MEFGFKSSTLWTSSPVPHVSLHYAVNCFSEIIAQLANISFSECKFPSTFKQAIVTPLIKGHSLDKSVPSITDLSQIWILHPRYLNVCLWLVFSHTFLTLQISTNTSTNLPIDPVVLQKRSYSFCSTAFTAQLMRATWQADLTHIARLERCLWYHSSYHFT